MNNSAERTCMPLFRRVGALALLFIFEVIILSVWLDNQALAETHGIAHDIYRFGAVSVRSVIAFASLFAACVYLKDRPLLEGLSAKLTTEPIRFWLIAVHVALMTGFGFLSKLLYTGYDTNLFALTWLFVGLAAIAVAALAFIPVSLWKLLALSTRYLSLGTAAIVLVIAAGGDLLRDLWVPTSLFTLKLTEAILRPFYPELLVNYPERAIGTSVFWVKIAPECSGLEGVALILGFTLLWLILFRRECRFPNALVMLPAGAAIMLLMNALRIAGLIALGNAGARQIALGGFHSQVGWISFILVALATTIGAQRIPWLIEVRPRVQASTQPRTPDRTTAYLLPLITSLAVGMATTAFTSGPNWLSITSFLATGAVLLAWWGHYARLDWRTSWPGPLTGVLVFFLWIGLSRGDAQTTPLALSNDAVFKHDLWITGRVLTSVVTVPIAEELAFRGFLMRRIVAADFEAVPMTEWHWPAIAVSSILFGFLHGGMWLAGTVAGLVYAFVALRRGRIGEAVVAHMTTNALLAAYVIGFKRWDLW